MGLSLVFAQGVAMAGDPSNTARLCCRRLEPDLAKTVDQFLQITRKRAIVFIISDFLVKNPAQAPQHLAHQHDTTAIKPSSAPLPKSMLKMLAHLRMRIWHNKSEYLQTMDTPKAAILQTAQSSFGSSKYRSWRKQRRAFIAFF